MIALLYKIVSSVAWIVMAALLTLSMEVMAQTAPSGRLEGTVFAIDSQGRSYIPGAKVVVSGAATLETTTDAQGKWAFATVAPGTYSVLVNFPGLDLTSRSHQEWGAPG